MTWREHCQIIVDWVRSAIWAKYEKGYREHGGDLWLKAGVLRDLEDEIIDAAVYYHTAKSQLLRMANEGKTAREAYDFLYGRTDSATPAP